MCLFLFTFHQCLNGSQLILNQYLSGVNVTSTTSTTMAMTTTTNPTSTTGWLTGEYVELLFLLRHKTQQIALMQMPFVIVC